MTERTPAIPAATDACFGPDNALLPVAEAYRRISQLVVPIADRERVEVRGALNRVLASDVTSPMDVPGHTNSAVDGYAVAAAALPVRDPVRLRLVGTAFAGSPHHGAVNAGECVRVMTGAAIPCGTDTVIMQEQVERSGDVVELRGGHRGGENVRQAGEDLRRDAVMLKAGRRLMPSDLGLLASVGIGELEVIRQPRVSFFSTGDELRSIGEPLAPGQIYDSNRYTLFGMLARLGARAEDLGVVRDDPVALETMLSRAAEDSDLVITTGGVSTGDADHVKTILSALGEVAFWRIAIRPGRPLAFGRLGDTLFFGLPGNPVAVMVTFYQFVRPALLALEGECDPAPVPRVEARCPQPLRKKPGRVEYYRAILYRDSGGALEVRPTGKTGSGLLHTMSDANCFIVLDESSDSLPAGSTVQVEPFHGLI